jgi:hypothetical protein
MLTNIWGGIFFVKRKVQLFGGGPEIETQQIQNQQTNGVFFYLFIRRKQ